MPSGKQCRAHALRGEYFCFFHSQLHRAAKQPVSLIDSFDIPFLEDRCAVQLTITRVLRAFVNKPIDRQSVSTLLYGLQLALQSVDHGSWAIGFDTVEGISETQDGDEIAFDADEDLEDDEDEIEEDENEEENEVEEEEEEEEAPSDAASNPRDEGAGDPADEIDSENVGDRRRRKGIHRTAHRNPPPTSVVNEPCSRGICARLRACLASAAEC